mgnify:CR=1|tara:strand:+ start:305 stop:478 length:174 start_codon:yes stop_codon:yes gene_type:complete
MGNNTAWGNKAYKEKRSNGGSKQEAKKASKEASESYWDREADRQFGRTKANYQPIDK